MENDGKSIEDVMKLSEELFSAITQLPSELCNEALLKIQSKLTVISGTSSESASTVKAEITNNELHEKSVDKNAEKNTTSRKVVRHRAKKKVNNGSPKKPAKTRRSKRFADDAKSTTSTDSVRDTENVTQDIDPRIHVFRVPSDLKISDIKRPPKNDDDATDKKKVKGTRTFYGCAICERKFASKGQIEVHLRIHTGEKPYTCKICNRSFTQQSGLNIHLKRHNGVRDHSCPFCEYTSVGKIDMIRHVARHTGERNYSCDVCGKSFTTDTQCKDHIKHVHQRADRYVCQVCAFTTHRYDNLTRHMTVCHSNKEYFQCPVCSQVVKQRSTFIIHMRSHTGERPHPCPKCSKSFKSKSQVAAHLRSHTAGRFECGECKKLFKTKFHLRRHALVHTGEKPFSCVYCSYSCNIRGNINKHVRSVHGVKDFRLPPPEPAVEKSDDSTKVGIDAEMAKEKGEEVAAQFLTRLSLRKDEQLTVEDLQKQLEEKQRQLTQNTEGTDGVTRRTITLYPKSYSKRRPAKRRVCIEPVPAENEISDANIVAFSDVVDNFEVITNEDFAEEALEGETIILPSNNYICVQQIAQDDADDKNGTTVFYVVQCADGQELGENLVE